MIVDRIRGLARVPGSRLRAADENFRVHDARQRKVLKGLLAEVGIIGAVLAWVPDDMARAALRSSQDFAAWLAGYDGPLQLVDGHMRAEELKGQAIPVLVTDLSRAEAAKALATFDAVGGPLDEKDEDASKTLTPSATTGSITITASSAVFAATDVGRLVQLRQGVAVGYPGSPTAFVVGDTTVAKVDGIVRSYRCIGAGTSAQILVNASEGDYITDGTCIWKFLGRSQVWSSVRITGYTDSTHVTATVIDRLPSTAVTGEWRLGAWSDTTGWPQCVTFHEERIVFARGQTIWMSRTGDFPDFTPTYDDGEVVATHAITVTIADDEVQDIIWMASTPRGLLVGTRSAEYLVGQASANQPLAGDNVKAARQSDRGTAPDVPAIRAGGAVLFMQKAGRKLREMRYAYDADAYSTVDATILSEHITAGGVTALAWCEEPDGLL